jgi:L-arabinose 1-dehydrogenase [NAD(P)+]
MAQTDHSTMVVQAIAAAGILATARVVLLECAAGGPRCPRSGPSAGGSGSGGSKQVPAAQEKPPPEASARPAGELAAKQTVAITGAAGELGGVMIKMMQERGHTIVAIDRVRGSNETQVERWEVFDLAKVKVSDMAVIFKGVDTVIHLAALPKPWESYENVYASNMALDYNVIAAAAAAPSVKRLVYASTNHVQHGRSMLTTPETLDSARFGAHLGSTGQALMKTSDQPLPDSFYAISKLNGENLCRYFAREAGLVSICMRIGWIVPEDDPRLSKWVEDNCREYMRAMHLSHRDCSELFSRALTVGLPADVFLGEKGGACATCYAVSANARRVFDLEETTRLLGYAPQDTAEKYYG